MTYINNIPISLHKLSAVVIYVCVCVQVWKQMFKGVKEHVGILRKTVM